MADFLKKVSDFAHSPIDTWRLNRACNAASLGIEDIKSAVSQAQGHVDTAMRAGGFLRLNSGILERLKQAKDALGEVKDGLEKVDKVCEAMGALARIQRAINFLNAPQAIERDPEGSARAFGQLFVGLGHFCRYLGPLKPWDDFFENMGDFFVNVRAGLDPGIRWKKKFDQIEKESGMPMH